MRKLVEIIEASVDVYANKDENGITYSNILSNIDIVKNDGLMKKLIKLSHQKLSGGIKAVWNYAKQNPSDVVIAFNNDEPIGVITNTNGRQNIFVKPEYRKMGVASKLKDILYVRENNIETQQLKETVLQTKTIVNVDIQPEYEDYMSFDVYDWVEFLNNNSENNDIVFLYNGAETLGMISEGDYINWLFELGVEEDVINRAYFYDKGYAFFRFCMDSDIDEDNIADLVKYMYRNDINDSRDMDQDMWDDFMEWTGEEQGAIRELLEYNDDMINIPELMEYLIQYSNIVLLGGGMDECLKEVEIALKGLDKTYDMLSQYVY